MKRKYLILFSLSGLVLSLDQLTKRLVTLNLSVNERISLIDGFLSFAHLRNSGFAFGLFDNSPAALQDVFLIGIPVFALILIILIFIKLQDNQMTTSVALTTILGGAIGNLLDRVQYGYVIDFINFHWKNSIQFPSFNIADCSIVIGVSIMFFNTVWQSDVNTLR